MRLASRAFLAAIAHESRQAMPHLSLLSKRRSDTCYGKKMPKSSREWHCFLGGFYMRITTVIFAGSVAALAVLATPALAKSSNSRASDIQPGDTTSASPPCYSYEPKPDGSWTQLPCQEVGAAKPPQSKSAAKSVNEDPRARHAVR
jgi:hypothetical protein